MKIIKKRQSAFTLIEILVVLAIFSLVMISLLQFLTSFLNMKFSTEARQRIRNEGNGAADKIDFLVRNSVTIPNVCRDNSTGLITAANPSEKCFLNGTDCHEIIVNVNEMTNGQTVMVKKSLKTDTDGTIKLCNNPNTSNEECVSLTASIDQTKNAQITIGEDPSDTNYLDDIIFSCRNDEFTNGLLVKVEFPMMVKRKSMQATDTPVITETFVRNIAVRNRFDYQ
jgi:prepilin-type N-terminal cleavage/methylation domain-containing protein